MGYFIIGSDKLNIDICNRMKKIVFLLIFFFVIENCHAQLFSKKRVLNNENFDKPALSWGYFLGMNNYDYNFDYVSDTYDIQTEKTC